MQRFTNLSFEIEIAKALIEKTSNEEDEPHYKKSRQVMYKNNANEKREK